MTFEKMIKVLNDANMVYKLTMEEIGLLTGHTKHAVNKWRKGGDISLRDYLDWADAMGFEVTVRRKSMKL